MNEVHNTITEAAHGGYAKTYNRIATCLGTLKNTLAPAIFVKRPNPDATLLSECFNLSLFLLNLSR
jgi:hypothetical protein